MRQGSRLPVLPILPILRRFAADSGGATAIEYGLIAALLSVVVITAVTALGTSLFNTMNHVSANIAAAH